MRLYVEIILFVFIPQRDDGLFSLKTADSLYTVAEGLFAKNDTVEGFRHLKFALSQYTLLKDTANQSKVLNDYGYYHYHLGNLSQCLDYYQQALFLDEVTHDTIRVIGRLKNIGIAYRARGLPVQAVSYYSQALQLAKEINRQKSIASISNSLALLQYEMNRPDQAIASYQTALREWTLLQDTSRIALVNNNLGQVYHDLEEYDSALTYYRRAQWGKELLKDQQSLASTFHNIGLTYLALDSSRKANDYLLRSYAIEKAFRNQHGQAQSCNSLAELHLKGGDFAKARHYLDTARQLNERVGSRTTQLEHWRLESQWHEGAGEYASALRYHQQWAALRDSIFNEERVQVIEAQAASELQEEAQARQQAEQLRQLAETESQLQRRYTLAAVGGSLLLGLLSVAFYRLYRTNRRISERNALLVREQHHRVKNNLHVISGLLSLQSRRLEDDNAKRAMTESQGRIQSMALIHQGLYGEHLTEVNMPSYLTELVTQVAQTYSHEVALTFDLDEATLDVDRAAPVGLIVNEVVTNAGKYAFPHHPAPALQVGFHKNNLTYRLTIQDNGPGIDEEALKNTRSFGTKLIQLQAQQLRGTVTYEQKNGTCFTLKF